MRTRQLRCPSLRRAPTRLTGSSAVLRCFLGNQSKSISTDFDRNRFSKPPERDMFFLGNRSKSISTDFDQKRFSKPPERDTKGMRTRQPRCRSLRRGPTRLKGSSAVLRLGFGVQGLGDIRVCDETPRDEKDRALCWCLELSVLCLGFEVWGLNLGFGNWGLRFGVWGSGFRVSDFWIGGHLSDLAVLLKGGHVHPFDPVP